MEISVKMAMKKRLLTQVLILLCTGAYAQTDILELNPKSEVLPLLLSARAEGGSWDAPATQRSLSFLYFSDLHGSMENLKRIVKFYDAYSEYLEDAIHTGDAVACYMDDPQPFKQVSGAGKIINVIGNHDCWKGHKTWAETEIPYDATQLEAYKRFIKPFVNKWKVSRPEDARKKGDKRYGACYFHKDYPQSGTRIIFLDCMHYDSLQDEWFAQTLENARKQMLTVLVAGHYNAQTGLDCVDSGFSTNPSIPGVPDEGKAQIECMPEKAFDTVDAFIDAGGVFVCWLSGHDHEDYIGKVVNHSRQLQILVDKAGDKDSYMHEDRTPGTVNQDSFDIVTVNSSKKLLILQRIGCKRGPQMREKNIFCYNYETGKVLVKD